MYSDIIKQKLILAFSPQTVEIVDESYMHIGHVGAREGGETHFAVTVISGQFTGLSRVARHKLIYKVLSAELQEKIHALRIEAFSPEEI